MNIRQSTSSDVGPLAQVAEATDLIPGDLLAGMMRGFLSDEDSQDICLTYESGGKAAGFCYAVPEKLTDGTWNMLAIAVHPDEQGKGAGSALVRQLEATLLGLGARVLIADTSGLPEFAPARAFYRKNGYQEEARIRDFWAAGNDKVIYTKSR